MKSMTPIFAGLVAFTCLMTSCNPPASPKTAIGEAAPPPPPPKIYKDFWNEEPAEERDARMAWWRDARFGLFIHWGLYSIPAGEWEGQAKYAEWIRREAQIPIDTYQQLASQFNPVEFDADAWVRMAKDAGMKYIVITSKHHDGFCLWPSDVTEFDIASTPFNRDILEELTEACREHEIKMCFYYSIMDWNHPNWPVVKEMEWEDRPRDQADMDAYTGYMKAQLKELIERYDPAVLWFDGEWEEPWTHERGKDLYQYVRELKPDIIVNNRVDKGRRGMQGMTKEGEYRGDFGTPEQEIPDQGLPGIDWESCMTMNTKWGWNKRDDNWKSTEDLVRKLIDIASKGGNFLLNVGPKPDGTFPQPSIERLAGIGKWMNIFGESIYGTGASPFPAPEWGRFTKQGDILYAHVFDWPENGKLIIAAPVLKISKAYLLSDPEKRALTIEKTGDAWNLGIPEKAPDDIASVIVIETK